MTKKAKKSHKYKLAGEDVYGDVLREVNEFVATCIDKHPLDRCHNCTINTILSYCVMDMCVRDKSLESIIDRVKEEFANWDESYRSGEAA
tara:strand:+ start:910 stop:1179 length:270 start_codon:yes stop_codon:yes gene_type:complete